MHRDKLELIPPRRTEPWLSSADGTSFSHPITFAEIQEKAPFGSHFFYELHSGTTGFCTLVPFHKGVDCPHDPGWFRCDSNVLTVITPRNLARLTYRCHMPLTPQEPSMPAPPQTATTKEDIKALLSSLPVGTPVTFGLDRGPTRCSGFIRPVPGYAPNSWSSGVYERNSGTARWWSSLTFLSTSAAPTASAPHPVETEGTTPRAPSPLP